MPIYSKLSVQQYGEDPDITARASLGDLRHESKRLTLGEKEECTQDPALVYYTPKQWHKSFIDALLRPDDWRPPSGREFAFKPSDILRLCDLAEGKLQVEPTLLEVQAPIKVIGDIHGQYADLMHLFRVYGAPSRLGDISYLDYLFLGDYVDRGEHSLETICLLFALKVEFPTSIHLLRGNHETLEVNSKYGFLAECKGRLGPVEGWKVWRRINEVFAWMPLAARIDGKILCMHGGLSEQLTSVSQIAELERPLSFEDAFTSPVVLAYQLLWNDPNASDAVYGSHASSRGGDIHTFSAQQVEDFCQANDLELIVRAHQCVKDGFERFARGRMVTVFSAANYCGRYDNAGALLLVGRDHVVVPKLIRPQPRNPKVMSGLSQFSPRAIARRQRGAFSQSNLGPGGGGGEAGGARRSQRGASRRSRHVAEQQTAGSPLSRQGQPAMPYAEGAWQQQQVLGPAEAQGRAPAQQPEAHRAAHHGSQEQQAAQGSELSHGEEREGSSARPHADSHHALHSARPSRHRRHHGSSGQQEGGAEEPEPRRASHRSSRRAAAAQHGSGEQQAAAALVGGATRLQSESHRAALLSLQRQQQEVQPAVEHVRDPAQEPAAAEGPLVAAVAAAAAVACAGSPTGQLVPQPFGGGTLDGSARCWPEAEGGPKGLPPLLSITASAASSWYIPSSARGKPASELGAAEGCSGAALDQLSLAKSSALLGCGGAQAAAAAGVARARGAARVGWVEARAAVGVGCTKAQAAGRIGCSLGTALVSSLLSKAKDAAAGCSTEAQAEDSPEDQQIRARRTLAVGCSVVEMAAAQRLSQAQAAVALGCTGAQAAAASGLQKARGTAAEGFGQVQVAAAKAQEMVLVGCTGARAAASERLERVRAAAAAGLAQVAALSRVRAAAAAAAAAAVGCTGVQAEFQAGLARAKGAAVVGCTGVHAAAAAGLGKARSAAAVGCTGAARAGAPSAAAVSCRPPGLSPVKEAVVAGCSRAKTKLQQLPRALVPCFGLGPADGAPVSVRARLAAAHARLLDVSLSPLDCFGAAAVRAEASAPAAAKAPGMASGRAAAAGGAAGPVDVCRASLSSRGTSGGYEQETWQASSLPAPPFSGCRQNPLFGDDGSSCDGDAVETASLGRPTSDAVVIVEKSIAVANGVYPASLLMALGLLFLRQLAAAKGML